MSTDAVIANTKPKNRMIKFLDPLISLYKKIPHKEEKIGGQQFIMGNDTACDNTPVAKQ